VSSLAPSILQCSFASVSVTGSAVGAVINFKAMLIHLHKKTARKRLSKILYIPTNTTSLVG